MSILQFANQLRLKETQYRGMTIQNILLTNIHLKDFAGTELNTLSLAKELKGEGFNVDVATLVSGDPLVSYFQREQIPVFTMPEIDQKHYDLIFANHFPVLTYCLTTANIRADKIVYLSNSSLISVEAPPEYSITLLIAWQLVVF